MKKLLLMLALIMIGSSAFAMIPQTDAERDLQDAEDALIIGIEKNDLWKVEQAIKAGASVNEFKYSPMQTHETFSEKGDSPLKFAYDKKQYAMAEYLISRGADKSALNSSLFDPAQVGDIEGVRWLLNHGAQDIDDKALNKVKNLESDEFDKDLKVKYGQIIRLLEQAKRGPVKLTPTARPAAAKPAPAPVEAKQPLKLTPKATPAPAQPNK